MRCSSMGDIAAALATAVVVCTAAPALGQSEPAEPDAGATAVPDSEAVRLTRAGTVAWERGDHETALEYFELADRVQPSPKFHYNKALALAGLGRYAAALTEFEAFLRDAPAAPRDARAYAADQVVLLERKVATVEIVGVPSTALVAIDGTPVLPRRPTRVDPGRHNVHASVPGFVPRSQDFVVKAGETAVVELELDPLTPPAPKPVAVDPAPAPAKKPRARRRGGLLRSPWFWGAVGVVAGGLTVWALASGDDGVSCPDSDLGCVR